MNTNGALCRGAWFKFCNKNQNYFIVSLKELWSSYPFFQNAIVFFRDIEGERSLNYFMEYYGVTFNKTEMSFLNIKD